jgi:beta-alanine degradation protein BauB
VRLRRERIEVSVQEGGGVSEVQIDNPDVRVTRWTLGMGQETGVHRHEMDYLVVPLVDGQMLITDADGGVTTNDLQAARTYYRQAGAEHNVRNEQEMPLEFIEVEIRRRQGSGPAEA